MPDTLYTTRAKIERRISQVATDLRIDDDLEAIDDVIEEATTEVNGYCLIRYSETQLGNSEWVALKCLDIAVFYLCMRRLNTAPQSAQVRYEKAIEDLKAVEKGKHIPDAATRKAAAPVLSNHRVRLWPHPHVATTPHNSTGDPQGYPQATDPSDFEPNPNG